MIDKKTLKALIEYNQNQKPAQSFIIIYALTWLFWHNQIFTSFINSNGGLDAKVSAVVNSVPNNQYIAVFIISCVLFILRLAINFISFKSKEFIDSPDDSILSARADQIYAKDSDVAHLMATYEKTKQQLADSKEREREAVAAKKDAIKKLMAAEHELEEAKAEIEILTKSLTP